MWRVAGSRLVDRQADSVAPICEKQMCAVKLADMEPIFRTEIFTDMVMERMQRKVDAVMEVLRRSDGDWNQTLYTMLFRYMSGNKNREAYDELASLATYHMCLKERSSIVSVEALLLGASGLLTEEYYDDYALHLKREYDYLRVKHSINKAMWLGRWDLSRSNPRNHPILRVAQMAALVCSTDFIFDKVLACRTREDVQKLLSVEASEYWSTHYTTKGSTTRVAKRIGEQAIDVLAINVVIPVVFAYASSLNKEELKYETFEMYELFPAEHNSITRQWSGVGVPVNSTFDSQAILQLNNVYCAEKRCAECRLKKR